MCDSGIEALHLSGFSTVRETSQHKLKVPQVLLLTRAGAHHPRTRRPGESWGKMALKGLYW